MTEDNRTSILQRILNLRAKAEGGASEAEAMACIEKAERLMAAHRVEEAELALAESSGKIKIEIITKIYDGLSTGAGGARRASNRHSAQMCCSAISSFTNTRVVFRDNGRSAEFLGDRPDVEIAIFLLDLVRNSLDRAYADWRRAQGAATGYGAKKSFQFSMARRINERFDQMTTERKEEAEEAKKKEALRLELDPSVLEAMVREENMPELTNTALVLIAGDAEREREVAKAYRNKYPKLGKISGLRGGSNFTAGQAGREAGNRVHLGRSIGSSSNTRLAG